MYECGRGLKPIQEGEKCDAVRDARWGVDRESRYYCLLKSLPARRWIVERGDIVQSRSRMQVR